MSFLVQLGKEIADPDEIITISSVLRPDNYWCSLLIDFIASVLRCLS